MQGYIGVHGHKIDCIIGVYPHEQKLAQTIYVDLKLKTDFSICCASDDVADTIDYDLLVRICNDIAHSYRYNLIETYADAVLTAICAQFNISWVWICVRKPAAIPSADYSSVELERHCT
jgi:dihydroneopterin aldolase